MQRIEWQITNNVKTRKSQTKMKWKRNEMCEGGRHLTQNRLPWFICPRKPIYEKINKSTPNWNWAQVNDKANTIQHPCPFPSSKKNKYACFLSAINENVHRIETKSTEKSSIEKHEKMREKKKCLPIFEFKQQQQQTINKSNFQCWMVRNMINETYVIQKKITQIKINTKWMRDEEKKHKHITNTRRKPQQQWKKMDLC